MHKIQKKLLELSKNRDLGKLSLREIGALLDDEHPQTVKHHLQQLVKKNFLNKSENGSIFNGDFADSHFCKLPIFGIANCGPATRYATDSIQGYLKISKSLIIEKNTDNLFIVEASGDSMDNANINGECIEDGDYVVINSKKTNELEDKYILSIIDGLANIKRFHRINKETIALISDSKKNYPPIYISESDYGEYQYLVSGVVIQVIKKPN